MSSPTNVLVKDLAEQKYKYGFVTAIEQETAPIGLSEDTIRFISAKKNEPEWLLEWRLKAFRHWLTLTEPDWAKVNHPQNRLSGRVLLFRAETVEQAANARRSRSRIAENL